MNSSSPPPPDADHTHAHRARWWRVGQNAGANVAAKIATGLCTLALVPLLIGRLGVETFGWLSALLGFAGLAQFADLGVALALQSRLATLAARHDEGALENCFRSGERVLRRLALAWAAIALPLAVLGGPHLLHTPAGVSESSARLAWAAVALAIGAGVSASAGQRLAAATQQSWVNAWWTTLAAVAALGAVWAFCLGPDTVGAAVIIICAGQILPGWATRAQLARQRGWRGGTADADLARELQREGFRLASANLAGGALAAGVPFFFAHYGGYGASALFAALQRLFNLAAQTHALLLTPFAPAYAEALAAGDRAWLRRSWRLSLLSTGAAAAGAVALALLWPWFGTRWLGVEMNQAGAAIVVWGVTLWTAATLALQACSYLLLGLDRLAAFGPAVALGHAATVALAWAGGFALGASGIAVALAVGAWLGPVAVLARGCARAIPALAPKDSTPGNRPTNL
ncbi:MAG: hypothetical protein KF715_09040 [Candidatus Didemnitutus sp.]|nr:hypothetical protein [Candidatus Didemnitutus sp.]